MSTSALTFHSSLLIDSVFVNWYFSKNYLVMCISLNPRYSVCRTISQFHMFIWLTFRVLERKAVLPISRRFSLYSLPLISRSLSPSPPVRIAISPHVLSRRFIWQTRRLYPRNNRPSSHLTFLFFFFLYTALRPSSASLPRVSHVSFAHLLSVALFFSFLLHTADTSLKLPFIRLQRGDVQLASLSCYLVGLITTSRRGEFMYGESLFATDDTHVGIQRDS